METIKWKKPRNPDHLFQEELATSRVTNLFWFAQSLPRFKAENLTFPGPSPFSANQDSSHFDQSGASALVCYVS